MRIVTSICSPITSIFLLSAMWEKLPQEELTPEIEQMIVEEVRAVRVEKRIAREQAGRADRS